MTKLSAAQARILAEARANGHAVYDARSRKSILGLQELGLVSARADIVPRGRDELVVRITVTPVEAGCRR